jgi:hypothetical protein
MHLASTAGFIEAVKLLLEVGAEYDVADEVWDKERESFIINVCMKTHT